MKNVPRGKEASTRARRRKRRGSAAFGKGSLANAQQHDSGKIEDECRFICRSWTGYRPEVQPHIFRGCVVRCREPESIQANRRKPRRRTTPLRFLVCI